MNGSESTARLTLGFLHVVARHAGEGQGGRTDPVAVARADDTAVDAPRYALACGEACC